MELSCLFPRAGETNRWLDKSISRQSFILGFHASQLVQISVEGPLQAPAVPRGDGGCGPGPQLLESFFFFSRVGLPSWFVHLHDAGMPRSWGCWSPTSEHRAATSFEATESQAEHEKMLRKAAKNVLWIMFEVCDASPHIMQIHFLHVYIVCIVCIWCLLQVVCKSGRICLDALFSGLGLFALLMS